MGGYDGEDANANLIFSISSGTLPTGLSLNANGAITGTPSAVTANTTNNFSVIITDSAGNQSAERAFSLTVLAPITIATYSYTGADQSFTVPTGFNNFIAYLWGAGAGGGGHGPGGRGGVGGYTTGTVTAPAGTQYAIVVGKGGETRGGGAGPAGSAYGFPGNAGGSGFGGQGGGLTGIFTGATSVTNSSPNQARAVLIAGGGGGGAYDTPTAPGGPGGGSSGVNGSNATPTPGTGGTQSSAGGGPNPASIMQGGTANGGDGGGGGGGGGGYYGGGAGSGESGGAGGGGSGYIGHASVSNGTTTAAVINSTLPPQSGSSYYSAGIGIPATIDSNGAVAGHGRIVITI